MVQTGQEACSYTLAGADRSTVMGIIPKDPPSRKKEQLDSSTTTNASRPTCRCLAQSNCLDERIRFDGSPMYLGSFYLPELVALQSFFQLLEAQVHVPIAMLAPMGDASHKPKVSTRTSMGRVLRSGCE